jgi:hypothetical protein
MPKNRAAGQAKAAGAPLRQPPARLGAVGVSLAGGTFSPVPAALPAGRTPVDISHTWDGVLHAVDQDGAPYVYDRAQLAWSAVGEGIDAAARVGSVIYHFRGPEYVTCEFGVNQVGAPVPITQTWPGLPRSFQLGVCGAASLGGKLYLFAQGRYVCVDEPGQVFALTDLAGWPSAPAWAEGVIDGTFSLGGDQVMVFRGGAWVTFSISSREVLGTGPTPLAQFAPFTKPAVPAEMLGPGFSGGFTYQDGPPQAEQPLTVYSGTTALGYEAGAVRYLPAVYPGWPDSWHPQLAHALTGRSGALWSATKAGQLVSLAADGFHSNPQQASQVSAGTDGSVYFVDRAGTSVHALADPSTPVFTSPAPIKQLSHGRAQEVWALDERGSASRITVPGTGAAATAQAVFQAQGISANADGSVWHIGTGGQPARYTDATGASETFPGAPAADLVGSNSAGHGYIVSGAAAGNPGSLTIHEYTSPFLFKTMGMPPTHVYDSSVAYGGGRVFYCTYEPPSANRIIACDYESGEVVWIQVAASGDDYWNAMAYSQELDCLVAVSGKNGISVFRASDGEPCSPELNDFRDNPADSVSVDGTFAVSFELVNPILDTGMCMAWDLQTGQMLWRKIAFANGVPAAPLITEQYVFYMAKQDGTDIGCVIYRGDRDEADGPPFTPIWSDQGRATNNHWSMLLAPVASENFTTDEALYFVDGKGDISAVSFDGTQTFTASPASLIGQGTVQITSDLTYAGGCIWFGCSVAGQRGALVGLDTRNGLSLVPHTPFFPDVEASAVPTSPLLYRNPQGQPLVVFGTTGVAKLWAFNPVDGSFGSIDTMGTEIAAMTADAPLGIVRCGGAPSQRTPESLTAYYGIRLDGIPLTSPPQYSVVADSQLMQDPDPQAANQGSTSPDNPIPPSAARYQTHITVVDAGHTPVPNLEVKLYVDQATGGVPLTVQGQAVTVPPSGLIVTTDLTGKITVVSDAADLTTAALRVWAPFMDNSERMVIYPDHEFHQRVMTAHADAADDDPGKVNLVTAQDYNGNPYFTSQEKSGNVPQQTATSVQQVGNAIGVGTGASGSAVAGRLGTVAAKYATYTDTGGLNYYPADTIAQRPLPPPAAAFALHIHCPADGPPAHNVLSLPEAGAVIDGLQGDPWTPPSAGAASGPAPLGGWWDDFWNWVKTKVENAVKVIEEVVITVADVVQVAIQVMDNGIQKVFHWVVKKLEDAVKAIGSFFLALGKLIVRTVEALSLLFNFKEILITHHQIQSLMDKLIKGDPQDPQTYPGLVGLINNHAIPAVNTMVGTAEQKINQFIDNLKNDLTAKQPASQLQGQGSTEHTAYQVPSKDGSATHTHAVHCSWASDAAKRHVPNATSSTTAGAAANLTGNLLENFIHDFVTSFSGGGLAATADQLKNDFTHMFTGTHSVADFLATAIDALLDFIKLLLDAILQIAEGLCDAALDAIATMIGNLYDMMTEPIDIPFISWLYTKLTGEEFTILGAALFVVAIPTAILFRVMTGKNPSQAGALGARAGGTATLGAASLGVQVICGAAGIAAGMLGNLIASIFDIAKTPPPAAPAICVAALGIVAAVATNPWISKSNPPYTSVYPFVASLLLIVPPVFAAYFARNKEAFSVIDKAEFPDGIAFTGCCISVALILLDILAFLETPSKTIAKDIGFAAAIAGTAPGIAGFFKVKAIDDGVCDGTGKPIAGLVRLGCSLAIMICKLIVLGESIPGPPPPPPSGLPAAQPA